MEGMMDSSAVTLVVKTPNRSIDDLEISCALNWTVEKLKRHLSSVYPSKPESKKQRLIYSGQLLLDHQTVKEFLREHQDGKLHTVHLVCPPSSSESLKSTSMEPSSTTPSTTTPSTTSSTSPSTPSTPSPSTAQPTNEGLRYRGHNTPPLPMFTPRSPPMWPTNGQHRFQAPMSPMFPMSPYPQMNYQLWMQHMQQMYQQQMAAASHQQANFMYMPPNMQVPQMPHWTHPGHPMTMPTMTPPSPQQPIPPQTPQAQPQAQPQAPPQPAPPAEQANIPQRQPAQPRNQEVRMNAQGGIADDDDDEENVNNDWLDKIYTLCRVAILLSIVWFYSSTGRFLMLILSVLLIYMYQWGAFQWLFRNRNQQPRVQENNPPPPQQVEPQQDEQVNETDNNTEQEEDSSSGEESTESGDNETPETVEQPVVQPPPPPPGPSTFRVAFNFVSSFFTSLVPQHNEVFQGN